jgi:hypothetical protein
MIEEENPGTDPPEARAVDDFFLAVQDGDEKGVAAALRNVGELRGFALTYLADVLDPATVKGKNPWRIEFQKPTKGRPKKSNTKLSPFLRYLSVRAQESFGFRAGVAGRPFRFMRDAA